mgnify:FL=1
MVDVLKDLRAFARMNGMFDLAEHLDDTIHVAVAEIALHARRADEGGGAAAQPRPGGGGGAGTRA